jgi:poly(A) polymerase
MRSTKKVMLEEFKRADAIVNQIHAGKKTWADLFERHTFFTKDHKYYLSVVAASRTKEAHDMFAGLVQSKVRLLVKGIEDGDAGVDIARPYVKAVDRVHGCQNEDEVDRVIQGNTDYQIKAEDGADTSKYQHVIYTSTFYVGLTLPEGKFNFYICFVAAY